MSDKPEGDTKDMQTTEQTTEEVQEPKLSAKEQAEMLRNYVSSMEKVQGYTEENVRDILDTVYRRFLLVLNYSPLSKDPAIKEVKTGLKKVFDDEIERYKDKQ